MNPPDQPQLDDISPAFLMVFGLVGGAMGYACGRIPVAYAKERRRDGLALASMIACVLAGFLGGCLLAMPVALGFTVIILVVGEAPSDYGGKHRKELYRNWQPPVAATGPALAGPYSKIGGIVVCNECRHAHKPGPEGIPESCPACGLRFRSKAAEIPVVAPAPSSDMPDTRLEVGGAEPRRKLVSWREERRRGGNAPRGEKVVSARRRIAQSREDAVAPPPPVKGPDEVIELRPESEDPRGW